MSATWRCTQFADPQAAGIGRLQEHPVAARPRRVEQRTHLLDTEHGWNGSRSLAIGDEWHRLDAAQRGAVEEPQRRHDLVELTPRHALFEQVELERAEMLDAELIGRPVEVVGKPGDAGDIRFDGPGGVVAEAKIVDEPLPKRGHGAAPR